MPEAESMIEVTANGERFTVPAGQPLPDFLAARGQAQSRVVVEHNGAALTPAEARAVTLQAGDRLEIVRIVAGG